MTTEQQSKQLSFSQAEYESKKKLTRRDLFLAKMESVVPWVRLIAVIRAAQTTVQNDGGLEVYIARILSLTYP